MNELIPFKETLQGAVRSSLGRFERRGQFPRPASLPDASVAYSATVLTVHLAELFLGLLVSFAIGVLIWMLIGSNLVWFCRLLFFLMGCGHLVDFARTYRYFRLQPNPTSPLPRSQPHADQRGTAPELISDGQAAPAGTEPQADSSEPQVPAATAEPSQTDSNLAEPQAQQVDATAAPAEGASNGNGQPPNTVADSSAPKTAPPPVVVEFKSFDEPIDTAESLREVAVTTPNVEMASSANEDAAFAKFRNNLNSSFLNGGF